MSISYIRQSYCMHYFATGELIVEIRLNVSHANAHVPHPRTVSAIMILSVVIPPRLPFHYRAGWPEEVIFRMRIVAARS